MTQPATGSLDLSFLDEEEARKILGVLERDELLRTAEKERVSKLQTAKRDVKWLHAVSGEWFEEIQKKKFKNDPDVRNLVKPPLTYRLRKRPLKGDSENSRMSSSRPHHTPKSSGSGPSLLSLRSPFSSLFSFRKSSKQNAKLPNQQERHDHGTANTDIKKKFELYQSSRSVKQIAKLFESPEIRTKVSEKDSTSEQLEQEVFKVLGDLDQKLAQEQKQSFSSIRSATCYRTRHHYSGELSPHNLYDGKEINCPPLHDGTRSVSSGEGHRTRATYHPRKFSDMYSNRHRTLTKEPPPIKNMFEKSPSLYSALASKSPSSAPSTGSFSSSSLQHTPLAQTRIDLERTKQQRSKRIPITSIKWGQSSQMENNSKPFRSHSSLDLTNVGSPSIQNRIYDLYRDPTYHREPERRTTKVFTNNSDDRRSSAKDQADSPAPLSKTPLQIVMVWEEENKENSFKPSELKVKPVSDSPGMASDKDVEPMETECENEWQQPPCNNLNTHHLQERAGAARTKNTNIANIPLGVPLNTSEENISREGRTRQLHQISTLQHKDGSIHSMALKDHIEHKPLKILYDDLSAYRTAKAHVPKVSSQTREWKSYTSQGSRPDKMEPSSLPMTEEHSKDDEPQPMDYNVFPCASNNSYSQTSNIPSLPHAKKTSPLPVESITEKNACSKMVGDNEPTSEIKCPSSDILKNRIRYAPSLPEVSDWKNYLYGSTRLKSEVKHAALHPAVTQEIKSSNQHSATEDQQPGQVIPVVSDQHKPLRSTTSHGLQKRSGDPIPVKSPAEIIDNRGDINKTLKEATQRAIYLGTLRCAKETSLECCDLSTNRRFVMQKPNVSDTNNNKQSVIQISDTMGTYDTIRSTDLNVDSYINENMKSSTHFVPLYTFSRMEKEGQHPPDPMSNCGQQIEKDIPSKLNLSVPYKRDVSVTRQQSTERGSLEKPGTQSETNINQSLIHDLNKYADSKQSESVETAMTTFPVRRFLEERLQVFSSSRAPSPSTNLLKDHLLLAPEPFKVNTTMKENRTLRNYNPVVSDQSSYNTDCPISHATINSPTGEPTNHENMTSVKAYEFTSITENTQIYETRNANCAISESGQIEYHKLVSIYYSLPRKYSKKVSDISNNRMKKMDSTRDVNIAPSTLLEKMANRHQKPHIDCNPGYPDFKPSPFCTTEFFPEKEITPKGISQSMSSSPIFPVIPLETNLLQNHVRSFSDHVNISPDLDISDKFGSLQISPKGIDYNKKDDFLAGLEPQRNSINDNEYINFNSSGRNKWNSYTLPNRRPNAKDVGKKSPKKSVSPVHDNIYPHVGKLQHSPKSSKGLSSSPEFANYNLNYSPSYNVAYPYYEGSDEKAVNMTNLMMSNQLLHNEGTGYEGTRQTLDSVYRSKSLKDLNERESYNFMHRGNMPCSDWKNRPPISPQSNFSKPDKSLYQRRPSYCSQFVQNQMKSAKVAKKFTFSLEHLDQHESNLPFVESFHNSPRMSDDFNSPFVHHSANDSYHCYSNKHLHGWNSPPEWVPQKNGSHSNLYRSKSLKTLSGKQDFDSQRQNDQHFSSKSYGGNLRHRSPSAYSDCSNANFNRRFSNELLIDENDNWSSTEMSYNRKPVYTSKSLDYGIFGKEQQATLLNNVKRSLTEGRLWRPSFLKNPGFLRDLEDFPTGDTFDSPAQGTVPKGSLNIYEDKAPACSDSDTTTDDEYYLDELDKESEL
ncbi:exophilin-5 [Pelodytes ibericus]